MMYVVYNSVFVLAFHVRALKFMCSNVDLNDVAGNDMATEFRLMMMMMTVLRSFCELRVAKIRHK